ncbi:MAG: ABC transporter permease subunit, partial [Halomonas sp.]|nr:ABC transporter permease subunit [Halomonas sp.]
MLLYVFKRLFQAIPTLLIVITLSFFLMHLAPGGPFDGERQLPAEIEANLRAAYHLDQPVWKQYLIYLSDLMHGDFGPSFRYKDFSVTELIAQGFPVSLELGLWAIVLAIALGLPLGIVAALRRNTSVDYLVMGTALAGVAIPNFVIAPILALVFGVLLAWLPVGGWNDGHWRN